jgi:hypothetical protein
MPLVKTRIARSSKKKTQEGSVSRGYGLLNVLGQQNREGTARPRTKYDGHNQGGRAGLLDQVRTRYRNGRQSSNCPRTAKRVMKIAGRVDTSWQSSVLVRDIAGVKRLQEEDGTNLVTQGSTELSNGRTIRARR